MDHVTIKKIKRWELRHLRLPGGAKGCQRGTIASRWTEGHLLWFNTESHNMEEEEEEEERSQLKSH